MPRKICFPKSVITPLRDIFKLPFIRAIVRRQACFIRAAGQNLKFSVDRKTGKRDVKKHTKAAITTKKNEMIFMSTFSVIKSIFTAMMFSFFLDRNA